MHLIKKYHNPRHVLNLLSEDKEHWSLGCFTYIRKKLEASSQHSSVLLLIIYLQGSAAHSGPAMSHLFPFIVGSQNTKQQFVSLYSDIREHLCGISKAANTSKLTKAFITYIKSMCVFNIV